MYLRSLKYSFGIFIGGMIVSDTFYNKVDRNLARPIRNYKVLMNDYENWVMPENITRFGCELLTGMTNMFKIEKQEDY